MSDSLRDLWASDATDAHTFPPEELDRRARHLHRRLWRRDAVEYAAGALVVVGFGWTALSVPEPGVRIGCVAMIVATIVVLTGLWRRRMPAPPEALAAASADFYRAELVRQRDTLRDVWKWYLGPFAAGILVSVVAVGSESALDAPLADTLTGIATKLLPAALLFLGIHALNRAAARSLDRELAALDDEDLTQPPII